MYLKKRILSRCRKSFTKASRHDFSPEYTGRLQHCANDSVDIKMAPLSPDAKRLQVR